MNIGGTGGKVQNTGGGGGGAINCKLIGAPAPNQCQIITFLTLKTDNIANLRIEKRKDKHTLKIPPNKIHILNWYICDLVFTVSHIHIDI